MILIIIIEFYTIISIIVIIIFYKLVYTYYNIYNISTIIGINIIIILNSITIIVDTIIFFYYTFTINIYTIFIYIALLVLVFIFYLIIHINEFINSEYFMNTNNAFNLILLVLIFHYSHIIIGLYLIINLVKYHHTLSWYPSRGLGDVYQSTSGDCSYIVNLSIIYIHYIENIWNYIFISIYNN